MKINKSKVALSSSMVKEGDVFEYGYMEGGRAFIARNGERISKEEAIRIGLLPGYYNECTIRAAVNYLLR